MTAIVVVAILLSVAALLFGLFAIIMAYGAANLNRQCMQAIVDLEERMRAFDAVVSGKVQSN